MFQFTPLREGRQEQGHNSFYEEQFQFTPLREGRHQGLYYIFDDNYRFNSRPCERGDKNCPDTRGTKLLFQFTPLREGRRGRPAYRRRKSGFNSRPCERGDTVLAVLFFELVQFQFTPLREGRQNVKCKLKVAK